MKYYIEVKKIGNDPEDIVKNGNDPMGFTTRDEAIDHAVDTIKGADINYWQVIDEETARENYRFPKYPQIVDPETARKLQGAEWMALVDFGRPAGMNGKRIKQTIITDIQYQKYLKNTNEGLVQEEI